MLEWYSCFSHCGRSPMKFPGGLPQTGDQFNELAISSARELSVPHPLME
jgi:hypothetical protein